MLETLSLHLHTLDISWNGSLTDDTFKMMLSSCNVLHEVIASGLKKITCSAFLPIVPNHTEWSRCCETIRLRIKKKCSALRLTDTSRLEVGSFHLCK